MELAKEMARICFARIIVAMCLAKEMACNSLAITGMTIDLENGERERDGAH